jgi:DNA helicase-2/ATP-dependent DNA helicase PcrA
VRLLRREMMATPFTKPFEIYDDSDQLSLIKGVLNKLGIDDKSFSPKAMQAGINRAKCDAIEPQDMQPAQHNIFERQLKRVYEQYQKDLFANNALDFGEIICMVYRIFRDNPAVRSKYQKRYRYIHVDEYQDTNRSQYLLLSMLAQKRHGGHENICVVGDEDQSIYKWRGADISNILNFEKHFSNTRTIRLEQNYRSSQTILDVAGAVVKNNLERKGKSLWTSNPRGGRVGYYQSLDAEAEARWVANKILEHRRDEFDIRAAVLYRTNAQSRVFEEAMRRAGLTYNIVGGFSFYERMEVRDIIAYLKLSLNPNDSIALQRVINSPPRGIGKQTLDEIERRARDYELSLWETIGAIIERPENLGTRAITALKGFRHITNKLANLANAEQTTSDSPVSDIVRAAITETGYEYALRSEMTDEAEGRLENLQELVNAAVDYDAEGIEGLRDFIDHSALVSDQDAYKRDAPVTLMTVHSAKGLEFPIVFVVGLEDGLFPHSRSATDRAELEEERRLAYVAMTRAERYLYVTHAMKRRVYGEELASVPSLLLNEMPLELLEDLSLGKSWLSFRSGSTAIDYEQGEFRKEKKKYTGKTYDSADSIAEFFKQRNRRLGQSSEPKPAASSTPSSSSAEFKPGSYVRHSKYGRGLVLRREGAGESTKLTVSFPGFGQKKLVEKYAGLEKA